MTKINVKLPNTRKNEQTNICSRGTTNHTQAVPHAAGARRFIIIRKEMFFLLLVCSALVYAQSFYDYSPFHITNHVLFDMVNGHSFTTLTSENVSLTRGVDLEAAANALEVLPRYLGKVTLNSPYLAWSSEACFADSRATLLNISNDGIVISIDSEKPISLICVDLIMMATSQRFFFSVQSVSS